METVLQDEGAEQNCREHQRSFASAHSDPRLSAVLDATQSFLHNRGKTSKRGVEVCDVIQEFCHFGPSVLPISINIVIASYLS